VVEAEPDPITGEFHLPMLTVVRRLYKGLGLQQTLPNVSDEGIPIPQLAVNGRHARCPRLEGNHRWRRPPIHHLKRKSSSGLSDMKY
jgi:hypothetical protein